MRSGFRHKRVFGWLRVCVGMVCVVSAGVRANAGERTAGRLQRGPKIQMPFEAAKVAAAGVSGAFATSLLCQPVQHLLGAHGSSAERLTQCVAGAAVAAVSLGAGYGLFRMLTEQEVREAVLGEPAIRVVRGSTCVDEALRTSTAYRASGPPSVLGASLGAAGAALVASGVLGAAWLATPDEARDTYVIGFGPLLGLAAIGGGVVLGRSLAQQWEQSAASALPACPGTAVPASPAPAVQRVAPVQRAAPPVERAAPPAPPGAAPGSVSGDASGDAPKNTKERSADGGWE